MRRAKAEPAAGEIEAIRVLASRLGQKFGPGQKLVYATGSLATLCGEYGPPRNEAERAWREVRAAAWRAQEEGRAALLQRRLPDGATEYLAVGLGRRR
jgi:hypothetical protein